MQRCAEARDDPVHRRSRVVAVVHDRERELERVAALPDRDHLGADLGQEAASTLRERLTAKRCERLRRAEALGGAADQQDPGRVYVIRHGSE